MRKINKQSKDQIAEYGRQYEDFMLRVYPLREIDRILARNPLLHIASTVTSHFFCDNTNQ